MFSKMYLLRIYGCNQAWLIRELPEDVREYLGLPKNDFGIDIIAVRNGEVYAVQCKWKKNVNPKTIFRELPSKQIRLIGEN